jgi:hypothetical protein
MVGGIGELFRTKGSGVYFQPARFCHQQSRNSTLLSRFFSQPSRLYLIALGQKIKRYLKHFCRSLQCLKCLLTERQPLLTRHIKLPPRFNSEQWRSVICPDCKVHSIRVPGYGACSVS